MKVFEPCPNCGMIGSHICIATQRREVCRDPAHSPPMHFYLAPGQIYVHVCPSCGARTTLRGQEISCCHEELKIQYGVQLIPTMFKGVN